MTLTRATVGFCSLMAFGLLSVACGSEDSPRSDSPVRINELSSTNKSVSDPADGDSDDWIELYNTSTTSVELAGYFLSDDSEDLTKFTFTTGAMLDADSVLLVWADGKDEAAQGALHVGFKLSGAGDHVFLTDPDGYLVDEIEFGASGGDDYSFARFSDGRGAFTWCATATPGALNGSACDG